MRDREEIEKLLREFPEHTDPNPDLANDAVLLAQELYGNRRRKSKKTRGFKIAAIASACCACLLAAILLPVYLLHPSPDVPPIINYYADSDLTQETTPNLQNIIEENRLNFCHFSEVQQASVFYLKATNQPVIVSQQYFYFDENNYDIVEFSVCLTKDEFAIFDIYKNIPNEKNINGINVQYKLTQKASGCEILAKCEVDSIRYYWTINALQGEQRLDYYINYLFGTK